MAKPTARLCWCRRSSQRTITSPRCQPYQSEPVIPTATGGQPGRPLRTLVGCTVHLQNGTHDEESADVDVARRAVHHHARAAVGRSPGVPSAAARAFHQPAPAADRTGSGAGDQPVLARRPQVVAVPAGVRRHRCAFRTPVRLVALAFRRSDSTYRRHLRRPGLSAADDPTRPGAAAVGRRPRRRGELLRVRGGGRAVRVPADALAATVSGDYGRRPDWQCGAQTDVHGGRALDRVRRWPGGHSVGARPQATCLPRRTTSRNARLLATESPPATESLRAGHVVYRRSGRNTTRVSNAP